MKALKWIAWIAGGLVFLAIVAVAIVAATFDPNQYKPQIVDLVKQRTGRTLTMDGRIGLTFFPKIGAEVEKVALSEPKGTKIFARVEEARVALALLAAALEAGDRRPGDAVGARGGSRALQGRAHELRRPARREEAGQAAAETGGAGRPAARDRHRRHLAEEREHRLARRGATAPMSGSPDVNLKTGRIASGVPGKLELEAKIEGRQPQAALQVDLDTGYRDRLRDARRRARRRWISRPKGDAPGPRRARRAGQGRHGRLRPAGGPDRSGRGSSSRRSRRTGSTQSSRSRSSRLAPDRAESKAITGEVKLVKPQAGDRREARVVGARGEGQGDPVLAPGCRPRREDGRARGAGQARDAGHAELESRNRRSCRASPATWRSAARTSPANRSRRR